MQTDNLDISWINCVVARDLIFFGSDLALVAGWSSSESTSTMSGTELSSSTSKASVEIKIVFSEEQDRLLDTDELEDWAFVELKPKHTIFMSHSGAQKNFVEQLCEDLIRAKQAPFFDKRPDSLPKGEKLHNSFFTLRDNVI